MVPPHIENWQDYINEVHPHDAFRHRNGHSLFIEGLETEGGAVEIIDPGDLSARELTTVCLGALGLSDSQISQTIPYTISHITHLRAAAYSKLGAANLSHSVSKLFEGRYARVVAPISPPRLTRQSVETLEQLSKGFSVAEAANNLGLTFDATEKRTERIREGFDVPNMPRAVLLGFMGKLLLPSADYVPETYTSPTAQFSVTPGAVLRNPRDNRHGIDYVEWSGGVFSLPTKNGLPPHEQMVLALSALGFNREEVGCISHISKATVSSRLDSIYNKLSKERRIIGYR
jgi:DNA-binding NarL/FixJ family response regulator